VVCALAVGLKYRLGFDDSLDVVGVHLFGGIVGTLLIGFFADASVNSAGGNGLFHGGGWNQMWRQAVAAGAVLVYSFVFAYIIGWIINKTIGFRVSAEAEVGGIDEAEHAETAYEFAGPTGTRAAFASPPPAPAPVPAAPSAVKGNVS
jgi:ammonium transporter, Amt family